MSDYEKQLSFNFDQQAPCNEPERFETKEVFEKKILNFENESYFDEEDEAVEFLNELHPELWSKYDNETKKKLVESVLKARNKINTEREEKQLGKGQRVKRVPPAPPGIDEIAHMIGEDKLASMLSHKRAKPVFGSTYKKDNRTYLNRYKEDEGKMFYRESEEVNTDNNIDDVVNNIESDMINNIKRYKKLEKEKVNPIPVIERLESLVGKLTTDKLAIERKLIFAKQALAEAMENLEQMSFKEIMELETASEKEKEDIADIKRSLDYMLPAVVDSDVIKNYLKDNNLIDYGYGKIHPNDGRSISHTNLKGLKVSNLPTLQEHDENLKKISNLKARLHQKELSYKEDQASDDEVLKNAKANLLKLANDLKKDYNNKDEAWTALKKLNKYYKEFKDLESNNQKII